ncbi:hypothetical protein BZG36_00543 [Bifiguratus adelaidae]|uniref:Uncharacterized protein n=1 Tax=Bifiguratus adelaidae TaxID=1938954 RepID=A0A261Y7F7_9FUNG|nr:hypothetical protein BZG36_00543 [Bifiguratus adelaidae]
MSYSESAARTLADYPVVIGIDFGTTFSGCCYAFAQNEEIIDITKWPRQNNNVYPKTPTLLMYRKNSKEVIDWGHGARRSAFRPNTADCILLSKFKLYLDENLRLNPLPSGLNVVEVIADYLRAFHQHVCNELAKGFAGNYDPSKFRYCLTVPAMWSDRAKTAMRQAAQLSGMISPQDPADRLMLISEPEAAALYCQKKTEHFNLGPGERFMICDAGGGTVDLIVFEIAEGGAGTGYGVGLGKNRTLKEVTKGHGGSCGSGFLDERMRDFLKRKLQYHVGRIPESAFENVMENFVDLIKPEFDGYEDHFLQLPASMGLGDLTVDEIGLENGVLHLPAEELRAEVFEPVIQQVLALIEGQLQQSPNLSAIFLVGGFGQSNYLFRRVEETFGSRVGKIGVPPRGELAVVRGAVYFGLHPNVVTERVSRRTYGIETRMRYVPGLDPIEYSVVGADNRLFCRQRFSVYVKKGESVKVNECISKNFVIAYPNDTDSDLFAYDGDETPPRLTTHPEVKKVASFPIKMPVLPSVKHGDKVDLQIRMYFGLTEIRIECQVADKQFSFTSAFDAVDSFNHANHLGGSMNGSMSGSQTSLTAPSYVSNPQTPQQIPSQPPTGYHQQGGYPYAAVPAPAPQPNANAYYGGQPGQQHGAYQQPGGGSPYVGGAGRPSSQPQPSPQVQSAHAYGGGYYANQSQAGQQPQQAYYQPYPAGVIHGHANQSPGQGYSNYTSGSMPPSAAYQGYPPQNYGQSDYRTGGQPAQGGAGSYRRQ